MIYLIAFLLLIRGASKGISDLYKFKYIGTIFAVLPNQQYFDVSYSWENKYAKGLIALSKAPWYYLWLYKPKFKEKFIYSSTFFVWATDYWHLIETCRALSSYSAILLPIFFYMEAEWYYLFVPVMSWIGFHLTYTTKLLKRKV